MGGNSSPWILRFSDWIRLHSSNGKILLFVFGIYGETGRNLYFWQNLLDMILPIPVCLMIGTVYSRAAFNGTLTFLKLSFVILGYGLLFGSLFASLIVFGIRKIRNSNES
ncbi:hypothetical protein EHQ76_19035 [Leptospira barantonii]|uniref:Uncharacterized protein n=1 Tax=Leptospira barantonii TaxID=2023184 RepID=A0A5F2AXZ3_9LEPT|nr:hypothetical protein [Leptospira barantonii]TGL93016.1 hypothetical protein EHQ76_19035 [Leptospira barantonii]